MAKTITIKQYRDRDGRLWEDVPGDRRRITHEVLDGSLDIFDGITTERAVVEYLVGPLTEV